LKDYTFDDGVFPIVFLLIYTFSVIRHYTFDDGVFPVVFLLIYTFSV